MDRMDRIRKGMEGEPEFCHSCGTVGGTRRKKGRNLVRENIECEVGEPEGYGGVGGRYRLKIGF